MEYRNILLQFITEGRQEEMQNWMKSHSAWDRLEIMNEFKQLMEDLAEEKGIDMDDDLDELESALTHYQEKVLDEQLASLKLEIAEKDVEKQSKEIDVTVDGVRKHFIDSILSNPPNVADLRKIANDIMQIEKDNDFFDPENWKGLL